MGRPITIATSQTITDTAAERDMPTPNVRFDSHLFSARQNFRERRVTWGLQRAKGRSAGPKAEVPK